MNAKELLLMSSIAVMGFGTTLIRDNLWQGVALLAVGCALLAFRGWLKEQ